MLIALLVSFLISRSNAFFDGGEWSGQGELSFQLRKFDNDGKQNTQDTGVAIFGRVEEKYVGDGSKHVLRLFGLVDEKDKDRDLIRLEDAYFSWRLGEEQSWKFLVGYRLFNWTATEAFHPADMVNSRNYDSDLENLNKLGEFTIELEKELSVGTLSFYYWPLFEEPFFPGNNSRLGGGVDLGRAQTVNGDENVQGRQIHQFGTRLNLTLDFMDASFHIMRQIDRYFPLFGTDQFTFLAGNAVPTATEARAYYFMKNQYGLTMQVPWNGFSFKFEGAYRDFEGDKPIFTGRGLRTVADHTDTALGFDYTFNFDNGYELIVIGEVSSLFGVSDDTRAELSIFQKDILGGFRLSFNDVSGTEMTVTVISDLERDNERLYNFSFARRLTDIWKLSTGIRLYSAPQKGTIATGLETLDNADHGFFNLTRYF